MEIEENNLPSNTKFRERANNAYSCLFDTYFELEDEDEQKFLNDSVMSFHYKSYGRVVVKFEEFVGRNNNIYILPILANLLNSQNRIPYAHCSLYDKEGDIIRIIKCYDLAMLNFESNEFNYSESEAKCSYTATFRCTQITEEFKNNLHEFILKVYEEKTI